MVAGQHIVVGLAQLGGTLGVALQIDAAESIDIGEGEDFAADFEHQRFGAEGRFFGYAGFQQAVIAKILDVHFPSAYST